MQTSKASYSLLERNHLDSQHLEKVISQATNGADDGELYLESTQMENLVFEKGVVKSASFDHSQGFGVRVVDGEGVGYGYGTSLTPEAIQKAASVASQVKKGREGRQSIQSEKKIFHPLYGEDEPLLGMNFEEKINLLREADHYARQLDSRVKEVTLSLGAQWSCISIIRAGEKPLFDVRPLLRFGITLIVEDKGKREVGSFSGGGRFQGAAWLTSDRWQGFAQEALRQGLVNLDAVPAPAGEMPVVLGPGWPGVLLHEAVGHGLEGDFNRKKTSHFSHLMGQRVAAKGVTVVDDGTLFERRGSLTMDDEGTPTQKTVLIEDGILVGYLQDRQNGRLMGGRSTGNGRRESYAHVPMPRMTNTMMVGGQEDPQDILNSVSKGIYAVNFKGGQVDITSGQFVFETSEAYLLENGRIGAPLKGVTLIGQGPEIMKRIEKIGHDFSLDSGIGTCGKDGQSVPVGVGQPTLLISSMTVGGTG